MLAIDTNVIVRFLAGDHPQQSAKARALLEAHGIYLTATVLLETEWVLRSVYDLTADQVMAALTGLAGASNVTLEDPERIHRAILWASNGMDFADALHLAGADSCEAFVTFDRRLANRAPADAPQVREP